ncbi:MAG: hypothetical protein JWP89_14 [Schlesneria sp.]|nr:hypothetical protein [Schlesneria sp.]
MRAYSALGQTFLRLLTYDFCPWANLWVSWVKHPIASLGFAALASLLCALFVKPWAIVALGAVVLVLVMGYFWPHVAVFGLSCEVHFRKSRATEDDHVPVIVSITNRWPWPVWGITMEGGFDPQGSSSNTSVAMARVAGWSTAVFDWTFTPPCRGEYPFAVPSLVTGFPFGLSKARRPVTVNQKLLVWPRIIPLEMLLDAAETRPSEDIFSDHRIGDSGDMTGTRPFRTGDSLRRVHWAQSARYGQLIVCERQAAAQSAIRVVFDSDPHLHRGGTRTGTLEWSIRIAASVCAAYHRENAHVECCFGHETLSVPSGSQGFKKFLDSLAQWKGCQDQPGTSCEHEHSVHQCHRIHHHNCGVFQLTITTDLGLKHRTEHRHVHGDQRLVVLRTAPFDESCRICGESHHQPNRLAIMLDHSDDVAAEFRRKWRQVCHAG